MATGVATGVVAAAPVRCVRYTRLVLAELAWLRRGVYRFLATLFLYPDEQRLAQLAAAADELRQYDHVLARLAFFGPWRRLLAALAVPFDGRLATLEAEYVRLFLVGSAGVPCPPYESYHLVPQGQASGWVVAQLERQYLVAGVVVDPGLGELPDHVAVELEFMAHLCDQEGRAWEAIQVGRASSHPPTPSPSRGDGAPLAQALDHQRAFLSRHLGVWFPAFARRVTTASGGGLYPLAAAAAQAFIHHDRDLVALLLATTDAGRRTTDDQFTSTAWGGRVARRCGR